MRDVLFRFASAAFILVCVIGVLVCFLMVYQHPRMLPFAVVALCVFVGALYWVVRTIRANRSRMG